MSGEESKARGELASFVSLPTGCAPSGTPHCCGESSVGEWTGSLGLEGATAFGVLRRLAECAARGSSAERDAQRPTDSCRGAPVDSIGSIGEPAEPSNTNRAA